MELAPGGPPSIENYLFNSSIMKRTVRILTIALTFILSSAAAVHAEWQAGAAARNITPDTFMWMAGYGSRKTPADGKLTDLWAKALVLEAGDGKRAAIVTLDLVGIDRATATKICQTAAEKHGLSRDQIALCTSHTHSGPVVNKNLGPLHYMLVDKEQQKLIDDYAVRLHDEVVGAIGEAISALSPARLQWGSGLATFAVNRRENKPEATVPEWRDKGTLSGPVDHDVPVLSVRSPDDGKVRALLFGYACHSTVLGLNKWNGDYPGYAQIELEKMHPDCVALFWAGCGADQNPLPRKTVELAQQYGAELAGAVDKVIGAPMAELDDSLSTRFREIDLPLASLPTKQENEATAATSTNRFEVARAKHLRGQFEKSGGLKDHYPYPVGVWKLGGDEGVDFVFLGGETVVDYALRIKREMNGEATWVAGYSNDVMAYVPSVRVLKEGGYEGGASNVYYGLPGLWDEKLEDLIVDEAKK